MSSISDTMQQAVQGMKTQSRRIEISAENLSNADTPGYRRKVLNTLQDAMSGVQQFQVTLDETPGELRYEPSNPMADEDGYVTLSNVSLVTEMADMREANRTYEANLNSFQQARSMYRSLLEILKR